VAKSEVRGWPIIGTIAERFGAIFIKRGCPRGAARTVAVLAQALIDAEPVGGFPGGATSEGRGVLRFYPAMFQAAVLSGAPRARAGGRGRFASAPRPAPHPMLQRMSAT